MDQKLRTTLEQIEAQEGAPLRKLNIQRRIDTKNKNKLRTFEPSRASIIKNIEPRPKFTGSYKIKV